MPERAAGPVEGDQRQAGDDRRQREGEVDQGVDRILAGELVAHQHPGDDRADDGVDRGHANEPRAQAQRRHGLRGRDGLPETLPAACGRAEDDGGQRDQHDHAQVGGDHARSRGACRSTSFPLCVDWREWRGRGRAERIAGRAHCCCTLATMPLSGSKNLAVTSAQPPRSAMVKRVGGVGEVEARPAPRAGSSGSPSRRRLAGPPACAGSR